MGFRSGLNSARARPSALSGTGTIPGSQYDQLSVTGAVTLANATLSVTSLPAVAPGTAFTLILNDGTDAVCGTFNGLPENAPVPVGAQAFRIHYAGGKGNDVTLVRDSGSIVLGPQLRPGWLRERNVPPPRPGQQRSDLHRASDDESDSLDESRLRDGGANGNFTFNDTNAFRFRYRFYRTTN